MFSEEQEELFHQDSMYFEGRYHDQHNENIIGTIFGV